MAISADSTDLNQKEGEEKVSAKQYSERHRG